jgi:hypothetical protein
VVDGFLDGSVPEEVYLDVMGPNGPALTRARQYEKRLMQMVSDLSAFAVGGAFLNRLNAEGPLSAGILITPSEQGRRRIDDVHGMVPVKPADAFVRGSPLPRGAAARGTGRGTSARITFNPGSVSTCGYLGGAEAILFHELVHGLRALSGTMLHKPMNRYDLFEEFVAVTLTNMLLSEQGKPLRDGHDCKALQMSLADFCVIYQKPLKSMKEDAKNLSFFKSLGALPETSVPWNPMRGW